MLVLELRRSVMKFRRTNLLLVGIVGVSCLAPFWTQTAYAQVKLEYKYPEGRKLTYKTTSKTRQALTLMGMGIETETDETVISSRAVGKKRADSTLPIEDKVESLHVQMSLPGGLNLTYDSSDPNLKVDNPALAFLGEVFKLAGQVSYTIVLDAQNKVRAIEGTEKLLEKADKLDPLARDTIRSRIEPDKLKTKFEQEHGNLPEVLARPGEPWERTEVLDAGNGQTITFHKKYEYLGTEKRGDKTLDKISGKAIGVDFKQDPESKSPLKVVKSDLKVESSDGTILFDREEGCVVHAQGKTRLKGPMTFSANGQEIPGDIDLTLESSTQLQPATK
jgi:Family of unknown function (DUF6263)